MVAKLSWLDSLARFASVWPCRGRTEYQSVSPSPLPRPEPCHGAEATGTVSSTQTAIRDSRSVARASQFAVGRILRSANLWGHRASHLAVASQQTGGPLALKAKVVVPPLSKKVLKIVLTPQTGIWYHAPLAPKRLRILPGRFFVCQDPDNPQNKRRTGRERTNTSMYPLNQLKTLSFMRTRSGSLAAVSARVPSHPAYSGLLCVFTANASRL